AAARELGLPVSVAPSATPLLGPAEIRRLKAAGVEAISLSLDGSTPERHDAVRGIRGTFERTLAAARAARRAALPFQINTLVARETLDDLPAVYELVRELGAARWSLFFLVLVGRGTVLEQISADEAETLMQWLAGLAPRDGEGPIVTTTEAPHFRRVMLQRKRAGPRGHGAGVRDGNGILFISHTGDVQPSGFLPLTAGNARTADVVALYREAPLFRALRRPERFAGRCGRCEFHWQCGGSRARASGRDLLGAERALQDRVAALGGAHLVAPGERVALHRARRLGDHVAVHRRAVIRPELLDDRGAARLPHADRDRPRHDIGEHERAADGAVRRAGYDAPPRNAGVRGVPIRSAFPGSDEVLARPAARGGAGLLLGCARGDPERCAQQQSWPHLSPPVRVTHNLRVCYPNTSSATSTRPNGALTCTPCT